MHIRKAMCIGRIWDQQTKEKKIHEENHVAEHMGDFLA